MTEPSSARPADQQAHSEAPLPGHPNQPGDAVADLAQGRTPQDVGEAGEAGEVRTGVPVVDDVLASMQMLGDRPVAEHVEVFESAHERLRGALDGGSAD